MNHRVWRKGWGAIAQSLSSSLRFLEVLSFCYGLLRNAFKLNFLQFLLNLPFAFWSWLFQFFGFNFRHSCPQIPLHWGLRRWIIYPHKKDRDCLILCNLGQNTKQVLKKSIKSIFFLSFLKHWPHWNSIIFFLEIELIYPRLWDTFWVWLRLCPPDESRWESKKTKPLFFLTDHLIGRVKNYVLLILDPFLLNRELTLLDLVNPP